MESSIVPQYPQYAKWHGRNARPELAPQCKLWGWVAHLAEQWVNSADASDLKQKLIKG